MKKGLLWLLSGIILYACGDGNVVIDPDPQIQYEKDSITIMEYLLMKGYNEDKIGNTPSGIRYVILDSGSMTAIDESDFVTFDYTGMLVSDTIFDTSIKEVGDSIRSHFLEDSVGLVDKSIHEAFLLTFEEDRTYDPISITYSSSGWNFPSGFPYQNLSIPFRDGFKNGVAATLGKVNNGAKVLFVIPSGQGFATNSLSIIPANSPLAFELYPIKVNKQ